MYVYVGRALSKPRKSYTVDRGVSGRVLLLGGTAKNIEVPTLVSVPTKKKVLYPLVQFEEDSERPMQRRIHQIFGTNYSLPVQSNPCT